MYIYIERENRAQSVTLTLYSSSMATLSLRFYAFYFLFFALSPSILNLRHPSAAATAESRCQIPPVIFNFGDSNSDTGGLVAGLGFSVNLPNGRSFFRQSTGRLSDGRLVLDFLCQSLNTSLLNPYLDSLAGSRFQNGANFAIVGSSTLPRFVPFALNIQLMQFLHFKSRALELASSSDPLREMMISEDGFRSALYMIDIGQNDIADSFSKGHSFSRVVKEIPNVISEIKDAVKTLYNQGGRKFWIHNTGPLGCLPQKLEMVQKKDLDEHGCLASYNSAAKLFNEGLDHMCRDLRTELRDATVVYVDVYAIKYDLIANATKYGFEKPLMACCGFGGPPYNYNVNITCGHEGAKACDEGSRFLNWDGIHYTETANAMVAMKVLSMQYSTPRTRFDFFCRG
ncbi:PREDICTED: GDSL esterase/lipase At1g09390 [Tarenaya hassleriana]|uniref:GDSL esterase/lipase At1g09390 n=1 Tax=Tarenaya hassleriana TaxID=28532 RepID=UPI00053C9DBB|nr:PREDICTED: GDSL esterase/lipase At1g09390 [Tarenaya hassleriana]